MPSIDERLEELENNSRTHDEMLNMLISIGERQQDTLERHQHTFERQQDIMGRQQDILRRQQDMLERHQGTLDRQQDMLDRQQEMLGRQQEMLEEIRRDARQTQRLWVRLAQRYGWLEDDDLFEN